VLGVKRRTPPHPSASFFPHPPPPPHTHTHTYLQNNAAFENLAKAGGPSMSALLSGPPSDLKKLLLFHVSPTKVEQDVELAPGKTLVTKLPGAKLQSVLAPEGKGVNIKPSSYAGKSVGPAGAGEQLIFFFFFGSATSTATPRGKKRQKFMLSSLSSLSSLSPLSLSPPTTNRRLRRKGLHLPYRRGARAWAERCEGGRLKRALSSPLC